MSAALQQHHHHHRPSPLSCFLARLSGRRRWQRQRHVRGGSPGAAIASAGLMEPQQQQWQQRQPQQQQQQQQQPCGCRCSSYAEELGEQQPEDEPSKCGAQHTHQVLSRYSRLATSRMSDCTCYEDRDVLRRRPPEPRPLRHHDRQYDSSSSTQQHRPAGGHSRLPSYLATLLLLSYSFVGIADACSSRSTPKPRPPTPTPRPNITFHMYTCPPDYAEWYCLNGATCFSVKIVDSVLYNCLCANGYIGQRCEFKDLDGSYLPSRQKVMLETASIAGAVTIAVFLAVITFISVYIHCKRKQKELRMMSNGVDAVDGPGRVPELRPFCSRSRSLMIFMAKNPNSSTTGASIEQTRMPNWNFPTESSTRMASVNETSNKLRPSQ